MASMPVPTKLLPCLPSLLLRATKRSPSSGSAEVSSTCSWLWFTAGTAAAGRSGKPLMPPCCLSHAFLLPRLPKRLRCLAACARPLPNLIHSLLRATASFPNFPAGYASRGRSRSQRELRHEYDRLTRFQSVRVGYYC